MMSWSSPSNRRLLPRSPLASSLTSGRVCSRSNGVARATSPRAYDTTVGGSSAFFVWANRGKDSVELDLKVEADRALFDQLVAGADVFIQNLSPSAASRAEISAAQLVDRHPTPDCL